MGIATKGLRNQICAAQICVNQDILKPHEKEKQMSHIHGCFSNNRLLCKVGEITKLHV